MATSVSPLIEKYRGILSDSQDFQGKDENSGNTTQSNDWDRAVLSCARIAASLKSGSISLDDTLDQLCVAVVCVTRVVYGMQVSRTIKSFLQGGLENSLQHVPSFSGFPQKTAEEQWSWISDLLKPLREKQLAQSPVVDLILYFATSGARLEGDKAVVKILYVDGGEGKVARLEVTPFPGRRGEVYPDPVLTAGVAFDPAFRGAIDRVSRYLRNAYPHQANDTDIRWRLLDWSGDRLDVGMYSGNSLGLALALAGSIALDRSKPHLDPNIVITGAIDELGIVKPVAGYVEKLDRARLLNPPHRVLIPTDSVEENQYAAEGIPVVGVGTVREAYDRLLERIDNHLNRAAVRDLIGTVRVPGKTEVVDLEKVFVTLTVFQEESELPGSRGFNSMIDRVMRERLNPFPSRDDDPSDPESMERTPKRVVVRPEELLRPGARVAIVGAPGAGKSTLMRWLALQSLKGKERTAVFVELKTVSETDLTTTTAFERLLFGKLESLLNAGTNSERLKEVFSRQVAEGAVDVFLDGLDEVTDENLSSRIVHAVNEFIQGKSDIGVFISSRPYAYHGQFNGFKKFEIDSLDERQIREFVTHYFGPEDGAQFSTLLRDKPDARDLASVPALLGYVVQLWKQDGELVGESLDLFRKIVSMLNETRDKEKNIRRRFRTEPHRRLDFLAFVAHRKLLESPDEWFQGRLVFNTDDLLAFAEDYAEKKQGIAPDDLVTDARASALLREVGNGQYAFSHLLLQEYLAATVLAKQPDRDKVFCKAYFDRQLSEMEVLPMTLGLIGGLERETLYSTLDGLPDSLKFTKVRLQARSLAYVPSVSSERFDRLRSRFLDFVFERNPEEDIYFFFVLRAFFRSQFSFKIQLVQFLIPLPKENENGAREKATTALAGLGVRTSEVVAGLLGALRDEDWPVRWRAAEALGNLQAVTPEVVAGLLAATTRDKDCNVRLGAAVALGQLQAMTPEVVTGLLGALRDEDCPVRWRAAEALGNLQVVTPEVVAGLLAATRDKNMDVRLGAAVALGQLQAMTPEVVTGLLGALRDEDWPVRARAAEALGNLQAVTPEVVVGLLGALRDEDRSVRWRAATALGKLKVGTPEVVEGLLEALRAEGRNVRLGAVVALGQLQAMTPEVVTGLLGALQDKELDVQERAAEVLGKLKVETPEVVAGLLAALQDKELGVRARAAEVLGKLKVETPEVVAGLLAALRNERLAVRWSAAVALVNVGTPEVVAGLLELLRNKDMNAKENAAVALAKLKEETPEVVSRLLATLRFKKWFLRERAAQALQELTNNKFPETLVSILEKRHTPWSWGREKVDKILISIQGKGDSTFNERMLVLEKAAMVAGYYSGDRKLVGILEVLSKSAESKVVREAALVAASQFRNKLAILE